MVRQVEGFDSKLQALLFPHLEAPCQTHINSNASWTLNAERSHIAVRAKGGYGKCRRIQPAIERLVWAVRITKDLIRQRTALPGQRAIGSGGDAQRLSTSQHDDIRNLPAAKNRIGKPGCVHCGHIENVTTVREVTV